jgi:hypothetical protein
MRGLYVYALVPAGLDAASLGTGLVDEDLQVVALGPMAAVVGDIDDTPSIAPTSLRRHDAVVRRIAGASDAILPFRFGATVTGTGELTAGLGPRLQALGVALERTRGCDQMTLRLYADTPPAPAPAPSTAGPGTAWLRARSAQRAVHAPELARVREALGPWVRAEAVEEHGDSLLRASVFHLVERARVPGYRAQVEALGATMAPARLAATGPWPPYAFTELE